MRISRIIIFILTLQVQAVFGQRILRGLVVERDSSTVMPFAFIINKSSGNGTMSDNDGRFALGTNSNDTLICTYAGYAKLFIPVKQLAPDKNGQVKLVMSQMMIELAPITVSTFKYKPYEREYMNDIIERSKIKNLDYVGSPITALYMRFSKEGKQINKLAKIFEAILIEEQVQKKLSRETLVRLTGDENIDYMAFRKYCYYVNDQYILMHDGVELYSRVMDCYRRWKMERREPLNEK